MSFLLRSLLIKIFISVFVLALLAMLPWSSASANSDIAGDWIGVISVPGTELGVEIKFVAIDDTTWGGEIDIPLQQAKDLPLANIKVDGTQVIFAMSGISGNPSFSGEISTDGQSITGDFHQGGAIFPFNLTRKSAEAAAEAKTKQAATLALIRNFIDTTMDSWKVPGLAMAIVKDDKIILAEGFGLRSIADDLPVTENTIFAIGSATKSFTTTTMAMLVDDGLLDWDEPVRTYLPTLRMWDDFATQRMTPRDLASHRSGLPRHDAMWYNAPFTRQELFDRLRYLEPNEDFRSKFQYQNLMLMTAGYLVGRVAGTTWEEVVKKRIFEPLGMSSSNFSVKESERSIDFAYPYKENDEDELEQMPFRDISVVGPAGSINSTAADMAQWVRFHLNDGKVGEEQLLSSTLVAEMHTPQMVISAPVKYTERLNPCYGLGWFVEVYRGHQRVYHGGNIDGFSALVSLLPQDGLGLVVLTNKNGSPLPGLVSLYATDLLLGLEPVDFHGRTKARYDAAMAELADEGQEEQQQAERVKGTKPTHKLPEYVGTYRHPGYGDFVITREGKTLNFEFNAFSGELEHWHYDTFRGHLKELDDQKIMVQFLANADGEIDRISVPLEISVAPIIFERQPPAYLSDPAYLAQLIGDYEITGVTVRIEIKGGNTLVVVVPGQPAHDLVPYRGTEYKFAGLTGYGLKFIIDDVDGVTAALFKQPNGIFRARKIK